MPDFRVTTFYSKSKFGWSETWFRNASTIASLIDPVFALLSARAAMLRFDYLCEGCRISTEGSARQSQLFLGGSTPLTPSGPNMVIPPRGTSVDLAFPDGPDQTRACIQLNLLNGGQFLSKRYLAGVPDQATKTENVTLDRANPAAWWAAYDTWVGVVLGNSWKVKGVSRAGDFSERPISRWVRQTAAPSLLGLVLPDTAAINAVPNSRVAVRAVKMIATGIRPPNGQWFVDTVVNDATAHTQTLYLRQTAAFDPSQINFAGTVRLVGTGYTAPTMIVPLRAGIHKRGKVFGSLPGRRRTPHYAQ